MERGGNNGGLVCLCENDVGGFNFHIRTHTHRSKRGTMIANVGTKCIAFFFNYSKRFTHNTTQKTTLFRLILYIARDGDEHFYPFAVGGGGVRVLRVVECSIFPQQFVCGDDNDETICCK